MKKKIAFYVDKDLGIELALWATKNKKASEADFLVLCKKENNKKFDGCNVKVVKTEKQAFAFTPDIVFSINYWKKISKEYVKQFKIINLHHSFNLVYRGRHNCTWAIINARKHKRWNHGTTLHIIGEKLDCGPIICTHSCPIYKDDTAYSLFLRVEALAKKMFRENYPKILNGSYKTKKIACSKHYYSEKDLDHRIDLNLPAIEICDRIRALTFPGKPAPHTIIEGQKIEFVLKRKRRK